VVEAALKSGSLITARLAVEQGKDVFAIPGSIHSTQARGCHALIKQGAKLVESAQDILDELNLASSWTRQQVDDGDTDPSGTDAHASLSALETGLLEALGYEPCTLDAVQGRCGMDTPTLQALLMGLELSGWVGRLPGGKFQRLAVA
jgi:DNA processing protein